MTTKSKPDASGEAPVSHAPAAPNDLLARAVQEFVDAGVTSDADSRTARLLVELHAVGIHTVKDAGPHRLGDLKRALAAALGYDAHTLLAAIEPHRRTK